MVQSLEVMSGEDSGGMDVSLDVSTSAEGAPSTSRSRNCRLLLVAAPFCLVAFGYIGLQGLRSNDASNDADRDFSSSALQGKQFRFSRKGLDIEGLTAYQTLTGGRDQKCGWPTEVHLKNTYFAGTDKNGQGWQATALNGQEGKQHKRDMIAKYPGYLPDFSHARIDNLVFEAATLSDKKPRMFWPRAIPGSFTAHWERYGMSLEDLRANGMDRVLFSKEDMIAKYPDYLPHALNSATHFPFEAATLNPRMFWPRAIPVSLTADRDRCGMSLEDLRADGMDRVLFSREAMDILLGSVRGRPAVAAGTWSRQVTSVFGAFFGSGAPYSKKLPRQGAGGWLAKELLERRVLDNKEPLVLQEGLQRVVAKMQGPERADFVDGLAKRVDGTDDQVKSAYWVIASLFFHVKRFSKADITTVLEVDEFFSVEELPVELARLHGDGKNDTFTNFLLKSAKAVKENEDAAADAEARRSGHRFLLRCWLLLERYEATKPSDEVTEVAEITAGDTYLRLNLKDFLIESDDLLKFLQESSLKISRRGPLRSGFRHTIPFGGFKPLSSWTAFILHRFPLYLAERVEEELGGV